MFDSSSNEKPVEVIVTLVDGGELQGELLCGLDGKIGSTLSSGGLFVELRENGGNPVFLAKNRIVSLEPAKNGKRAMPQLRNKAANNGFWADVLKVSPVAGHAEVKAAYHALAKQYHPDLYPAHMPSEMRQYANEMFKRINQAWEKFQDIRLAA